VVSPTRSNPGREDVAENLLLLGVEAST